MKKNNLITIPLAVVSLLFGGCVSKYEQEQQKRALVMQKEAEKLGLTVLEYMKQKEEREAYKQKMSNYRITYATQPSGASLICEGKNLGYTPITLAYNFFDANSSTILTKAKTQLCTAKWVSGFEKEYSQSWDIEKFPDGVQQTLQRPSGDGYKDDAEFGFKVETARHQQEQADIARQQQERALMLMNEEIQQRQREEETRHLNQTFKNLNESLQDMNRDNQMRQQNFQLQQLNNNLNRINQPKWNQWLY